MQIAITGSSGFLGQALLPTLVADGHTITRLVRGAPKTPTESTWDPETGRIDPGLRADAVVHLAGASVAARWTAARKAELRRSRVAATAALVQSLLRAPHRPQVLVCASGIGFYGDRGDEVLDERSAGGTGFLADLARDWEGAAKAAADAGIRVVHLRFGVLLGRGGGALARMLLPFRLGLGGRLGSGRQWLSWLALADAVGIVRFALADTRLAGPVLGVAPEPVTNRDFTRALAKVLHRPALLPVPAFALRMLLGGFADEGLLASQRAVPRRLLAAGYRHALPDLPAALAAAV